MRIFFGRPLAFAACLAAAVSGLVWSWNGTGKLILLGALLAGGLIFCLAVILRHRIDRWSVTVILSCAMTASVLFGSWLWRGPLSERYFSRTDMPVTAEGYVLERRTSGSVSSRFAVRLTELDGERVRDTVLLECGYRSALQEGDCFRLTGTVRDFTETDSYDEEEALTSDGLIAVLVCADPHDCTVTGETDSLRLTLRRFNRRLCERLQGAIGGETGALACAVLLGNRSFLSGETALNFRRVGVSHLLALSGLHLSILVGILEWLLRRLHAPKLLRVAVVPPVAIFYLLLTGAAVSTVRAVLMVTVLSLAFLSAERYDSFTALSLALFCILAVTPYAVADLSLWLSFSAAAAIIIFLPALSGILGWGAWRVLPRPVARLARGSITAVATGLFANNGVLPVSALVLGSVSVLSVPMTLVMSPLMTAALFLGILTLFLPVTPVAFLAGLPLRAILSLADRAAQTGNVLFYPTQSAERALVILSLVLTVLAAVLPLRRKWLLTVPLAVSAAFLAVGGLGTFFPPEPVFTYTHANSGEVLIVTQNRTGAVFDFTDGSSGSVFGTSHALKQSGCSEVGDLVISHYHAQTPGMVRRLCSSVLVRCVRLPVPQDAVEQAFASRIEETALRHGCTVRYDTSALAVPDAEVIRLARYRGSGIEASTELTLRVGNETLTALSGHLIGSDVYLSLYPHLSECDGLILLSHGRTDSRAQTIRLPSRIRWLIYSTPHSATLHPTTPKPPVAYVDEVWVRPWEDLGTPSQTLLRPFLEEGSKNPKNFH